jgi:hypothetical protein
MVVCYTIQIVHEDSCADFKYLFAECCGFVGSTTAAYGPSDSQGGADHITQYFLSQYRKGALCRAFPASSAPWKRDVKMDPADLKTIIQFLLLGDRA